MIYEVLKQALHYGFINMSLWRVRTEDSAKTGFALLVSDFPKAGKHGKLSSMLSPGTTL